MLPVESMVGTHRAVRAAENRRLLRSRGVHVRKTIHVLIGTFCLEESHQLLFSDREFEPLVEHLGLQRA